MTPTELRTLAKELANTLRDDKAFQRLVKETVLQVLVYQEEQRRIGAVKAFLWECQERHIDVSLTPEERLCFDRPKELGASLEAVLVLHRGDIVRFLKDAEQLKRMGEERLNGRKR